VVSIISEPSRERRTRAKALAEKGKGGLGKNLKRVSGILGAYTEEVAEETSKLSRQVTPGYQKQIEREKWLCIREFESIEIRYIAQAVHRQLTPQSVDPGETRGGSHPGDVDINTGRFIQ